MKPFDEKFADHVRETFDHYQEPFDEKAWQAMQSMLDEQKPVRALWIGSWPVWAAASVCLVLLSTLIWRWEFSSQATNNLVEAEKNIPSENYRLGDEPPALIQEHILDSNRRPTTVASQLLSPKIVNPSKSSGPSRSVAIPEGSAGERQSDLVAIERPKDQIATLEMSENLVEEGFGTLMVEEELFSTDLASALSSVDYDYLPVAQLASSRPGISFAAGPLVSYAGEGLNPGAGFVVGAAGGWKLSSRLELVSGGMLVYNSATHAADNLDKSYLSTMYSQDNLRSIQMESAHQYEFLALDIPLNLRWKVAGGSRQGVYLSVGVSSLVYLQQNFSDQYKVSGVASSMNPTTGSENQFSMVSSLSEQASYQPFSRLDLARIANISVAYSLDRQANRLVLEPFLKIPLAPLTSREIYMTMGGVSLRYRLLR